MATAPVYKATGTPDSGTGAISVPWPAGHATGDFALLLVNTSAEPITTPSGWTAVAGAGTAGDASTADSCSLQVFWRFATSGAMADVAIADSGNHTIGIIATFTGVSSAAAPNGPIQALAGSAKTVESTTETFASVTTNDTNQMVLVALSTGQESSQSSPTLGVSALTERAHATTTSGFDGGLTLFTATKATAGATGSGSATSSISSKSYALTFALRSADFGKTVTPTGITTPASPMGAPTVNLVNPGISGTLPQAYIDIPYSAGLDAAGGTAPYTWSVVSGSLPSWASLASDTGVISGTPDASSTASFTLRITDSLSATDDQAVELITANFSIDSGFDIIEYTGDGTGTRQQDTTVDLSMGGFVWIIRKGGGGSFNTVFLMSTDGSAVYYKTDADTNPASAPSDASSIAGFGNGTFNILSGLNASGGEYVAYVMAKHPDFCDIVSYTGDGGSNRTVNHSLGVQPGAVWVNSPYGMMWWPDHTINQLSQDNAYRVTSTGAWGTTAAPTSESFRVGTTGSTTGTNINGRLYLAVVIPESSPFVAADNYTGDGTSSRTTAVAPGWPLQFFYSPTNLAVYDDQTSSYDFAGDDTKILISTGATSTNTTLSYSDTGVAVSGENNTASTAYSWFGVRFGSVPGEVNLFGEGVESSETFGSPYVVDGLSLFGTPLTGTVDVAYSFTMVAVAGTGSYTYTLISGSLPPGLSLTDATVSGTPTIGGTYTCTFEVDDGVNTDTLEVTFRVQFMDIESSFHMISWTANGLDAPGVTRFIETPPQFDLSSDTLFMMVFKRNDSAQTVEFTGVAFIDGIERDYQNPNTGNSYITSVSSNGFTTSYSGVRNDFNDTGHSYSALLFKESAGFLDVLRFTGDGVNGHQVAHSLGAIPDAMNCSTTYWHSLGMADPDTLIDEKDGTDETAGSVGDFNNTNPTSTYVTVGYSFPDTKFNDAFDVQMFLLWKDQTADDGILRVGSYVGNGSTSGPVIDLGWKPQHFSVRGLSGSRAFALGFPDSRLDEATNIARPCVTGDATDDDELSGDLVDVSDTGLTIKTADSHFNSNGVTYYYLALRDPYISNLTLIQPTAIATGVAFGSPTIIADQLSSPAAIASAEALGSPIVTRGAVTVTLNAVASTEAFGSPTIEEGGTPETITPNAIASTEAFGSPLWSSEYTVTATAVASTEVFGGPSLTTEVSVAPTAIASTEAFGSPTLAPGVVSVSPTAIASAEAFGSPSLSTTVDVAPTGITTAEALGSPTLARGAVSVTLTGVASAEAFGSPTVESVGVTVTPTGITSAEACGAPTLTTGQVSVAPGAIASTEAFGSPSVGAGVLQVLPAAVASTETVGSPTLSVGAVTVTATGIASHETLGAVTVSTAITVTAAAITSTEALGAVALAAAITLHPEAITSSETMGTAVILPGGVGFAVFGIPTTEAFGAIAVSGTLDATIAVDGVASAEAFGVLAMRRGAFVTRVVAVSTRDAVPSVNTSTGSLATARVAVNTNAVIAVSEGLDSATYSTSTDSAVAPSEGE